MRAEQVCHRLLAKTISVKDVLQTQSVVSKGQVDNIFNQTFENQQLSTKFLNDDIQKTFEIINQMKNYSSNSLQGKEIEQRVVFSSDNSQVQDITLIKPGKQAMKRSMKRFLKKRALQKIIYPNLFNVSQIFMDLLLFQLDYLETNTSFVVLINNLLNQAESMFLLREALEQELIEKQMQEQLMLIKIKKKIENLSNPSVSFSAKEHSKVAGLTLSKKPFIFQQRQQGWLAAKGEKKQDLYNKQFALQYKEYDCLKHKYLKRSYFNEQISLKINSKSSNNRGYQHDRCQMIVQKANQQATIGVQQLKLQGQQNTQVEISQNHQNTKENSILKTINDEVQFQDQLKQNLKSHNKKIKYFSQLQLDIIKNNVEFIQPSKRDKQKRLQNSHLNIDQLFQQLTGSNKIERNLIQISEISIVLTQAQRNILINLIKQKKKTQIQQLMSRIICEQLHLFNQNKFASNKLLSNNKTPKFQELNTHLVQKNDQQLFQSQAQTIKQLERFDKQIQQFNMSQFSKINQFKLLGGGCSISKMVIVDPYALKEDDEQKLKSDKFFNEIKYADESQFEDFMKIYNKYYTNTEINHEVLENRIRTIVNALHQQCEHIFSLTIRSKVIELINLLINYYMIAIQKNDIQTLQKFIDKTGQELKDFKETCFQNRKKYPCLDLCQYFDLLINLNSQRQGIDIINQNQALKIAEIVLKLIKFGAGFTSIFGAIDTLSKIQLEDIQNHLKEIQQMCSNIFESSQEIGKESLEQYTNYRSGSLFKIIQAIWLKKIQFLGDGLRDEHQQIIFYLKEIYEVQNQGNDQIVLFIYMQLNYLLQKKLNDDNLHSFTIILKDTKQENLIFDFIDYLQFKTYSTTLFENAKKLLDSLITSEQFRQLKISLLLKFSQILENFNDKKQQYSKLLIYLCMTYLQENEISVKIVFKGNKIMKTFIKNIKQYTEEIVNESKQSYQTMKTMINNEEQLNKIANKIESKEDITILLAKTYVQMWEASVKQRQEQNKIAHKDDALIEVIQLYIKQEVTYLQGNQLFEEFNDKNEDNQKELNDALKLIIDKFLIPNFVEPKNKTSNQNKHSQQTCKILSILAEGGSGKSMILKKLEVELLKDDSNYIKDERAEYIPFIIKCNSLDIKKPSIEEYLLSQNISKSEIELLKRSERNKLIMLDGYDEYAGDYFKVYQKLKINDWVNTLVIVTSRLEKISVSDAKLYFNYYDKQGNQGSQNSFSILKLEKIKDSDINKYLEMYKEQQSNQSNFNEQKHNQLQKIIFQNESKQLLELLKLPINLYLTTRMVADLDLNDKQTLTTVQEASDQVDIQELFFQQQFKKLSQNFVEQNLKISTDNTPESDNKKKELINTFQSCYFEYFQTIAMLMFLQKGKKANFLSTKKSDIIFKLRDEVLNYFNQNKINNQDVIQHLKSYIDSRVITRIQLSTNEENSQNFSAHDETLEFEFRHKSLFEYFAARAMKYDFDLHKETVFTLSSSQLSQFSINKRIIMSNQKNNSEQQILMKLFKLLKPEIDSPQFKENYSNEDISKTNRYIQFLKKSSISHQSQTSEIDIGSSNLLSALFVSKFSFPNLIFKKCSFSQAYIQKYSRKVVEFQDCNLSNTFLEKQHLEYYESSNTKSATYTAFQQQFNTDDIFSFKQVLFYKNNLVTITKTGYINLFEVLPNKSQSFKKLLSNQITLDSLNTIHLVQTKNLLVATAKKSIFEVNPKTLEKVNYFTFSKAIASLSINNSKYVVTLSNKQILYGDIENGFKSLDKNKIQSDYSLSQDDFIVTSQNNQITIYNLQNLQIIKTNLDINCRLQISAFSADGKYLAACSDNNTCKIWNIENGFELINTIQGHTSFILSVAFSADSKYFATGSKDKTCKIWHIEKGFELINTIQGHTSSINSVSFSGDGKYLATGSEDNSCKFWNVESGFELLNTIQGHTSYIHSVAFSPDGKCLASGSKDNTCKIWSLENGFELLNTIEGHTSSICSVAFSADGKYLATGSKDKTCKVWIKEKGFELINTIQGHSDTINSVAFSVNGKYLATGSGDKTCKIWHIEKGFKLINTIQGHTNTIYSVAFSANGKYLATGSEDTTCKLWNIEKGFELINTIQGHTSYIESVAFSADGKYLATGSRDNTCKIWNAENGFELISTIQGHDVQIYSLTFSVDGKYLATSSLDKTCKIWNVEKEFELINTIQGHTDSVNSVSFSEDGKYLATGSSDKTCKIWNVATGFELINQIQGHNSYVYSATFSADGKYLATGSDDRTCKVWKVEKGFELINIIQGHANSIYSVAFSADGRYLATGSGDRTCKIWNVAKGFELINTTQKHNNYIQSVAFSSDGKYLATGSYDMTCKIWNVENGFNLIKNIEEHTDSIYSVAFSADGKYLATGSEDSTCKIWNVVEGFKLISTIEGHTDTINSVAFSTDGKYLATGSNDKTCKVWKVEQGFELINTIQGHNSQVSSVAFSMDGKYLATGFVDSTCNIWSVEKGFEFINTIIGHTSWIFSVAFSADGKYLATGSDDRTCKIWNIEKGFKLINAIQGNSNEILTAHFSKDKNYLGNSSYNNVQSSSSENFLEDISAENNKTNLLKQIKSDNIFEQLFEI